MSAKQVHTGRRILGVTATVVLLLVFLIGMTAVESRDVYPAAVPESTEKPVARESIGGEFTAHVGSGFHEGPVLQAEDEVPDTYPRTSTYRIFTEGVDFSAPVGVVVRLHGDGDGETTAPGGLLSDLAEVAAERNMILVAPRSPDGPEGPIWWHHLGSNIEWLMQFMEHRVHTIDGVDPSDIWWMGYSGGAEMISYGLLPRSHWGITGGALMLGGGGSPEELVEPEPPEEFRSTVSLSWVSGVLDDGTRSYDGFDARSAATDGSEWYRHHGFLDVSLDLLPGIGHYDLPQAEILESFLDTRRG